MLWYDDPGRDLLGPARVQSQHATFRLDYNTFHYEGAIQPIRIRGEAYHTITIEDV